MSMFIYYTFRISWLSFVLFLSRVPRYTPSSQYKIQLMLCDPVVNIYYLTSSNFTYSGGFILKGLTPTLTIMSAFYDILRCIRCSRSSGVTAILRPLSRT